MMMMIVTMREVLVGCRCPIRDAGLCPQWPYVLFFFAGFTPRAQRIDMDMLTQQIGVLRIGHEAMKNTRTQTQQALLGLQVQQNIGWNRMYAHYQRPLPPNIPFIPMPPQQQQDPSP